MIDALLDARLLPQQAREMSRDDLAIVLAACQARSMVKFAVNNFDKFRSTQATAPVSAEEAALEQQALDEMLAD